MTRRDQQNKTTPQLYDPDSHHALGVHVQVGDKEQIFGSVKAEEISKYIEKQTGRVLPPQDFTLPDIKSLGTYDGTVKLHPEVVGSFKVQIVKQPN